jgi:hypothetical protein
MMLIRILRLDRHEVLRDVLRVRISKNEKWGVKEALPTMFDL